MAEKSNPTIVTAAGPRSHSAGRWLALALLLAALAATGERSGPLARALEDFPDERPDGHRVAAFALEMYSTHGEQASHWLAQAIRQGRVGPVAADVLCDIDAEVVVEVSDLLWRRVRGTTDSTERLSLLTMLAAANPADREAHDEVRRALASEDEETRFWTAYLLRLRGSAEPFVEDVAAALDGDFDTHEMLRVLASVDRLPPDVEARVRSCLDQEDSFAIEGPVLALVGGGWIGSRVVEKAFEIARGRDDVADRALASAFLSMPRITPASVREIPRRLRADADPAIRAVGDELQAWMGDERPELAPASPPVPFRGGTLRDVVANSGASFVGPWRAVRAHRIALGDAGARRLASAVAAGWPPTRDVGLTILEIDPRTRRAARPYLVFELAKWCSDPAQRVRLAMMLLDIDGPNPETERIVLDAIAARRHEFENLEALAKIWHFPEVARIILDRLDQAPPPDEPNWQREGVLDWFRSAAERR